MLTVRQKVVDFRGIACMGHLIGQHEMEILEQFFKICVFVCVQDNLKEHKGPPATT